MISNTETAKQIILAHAGHSRESEVRSIIGSLRPFEGIYESDFRDFMFSLICLRNELRSEYLNRELVYSCWDFCSRIRVLAPSILANGIISIQQQKVLQAWGECVDSFCRRSFHQLELEVCLSNLLEYLSCELCSSPKEYSELSTLLEKLKSNADFEMIPLLEKAIQVIVK